MISQSQPQLESSHRFKTYFVCFTVDRGGALEGGVNQENQQKIRKKEEEIQRKKEKRKEKTTILHVT